MCIWTLAGGSQLLVHPSCIGIVGDRRPKFSRIVPENLHIFSVIIIIIIIIIISLMVHWVILVYSSFFELLFGCRTANYGPLSMGQPYSSDVNHCVFSFLTRRSLGAS